MIIKNFDYQPSWKLLAFGLIIPFGFALGNLYLSSLGSLYLLLVIAINLILWLAFRFLNKDKIYQHLNLLACLSAASLTLISVYIIFNVIVYFLLLLFVYAGITSGSLTLGFFGFLLIILGLVIVPFICLYVSYHFFQRIRNFSEHDQPTKYFWLGVILAIIIYVLGYII